MNPVRQQLEQTTFAWLGCRWDGSLAIILVLNRCVYWNSGIRMQHFSGAPVAGGPNIWVLERGAYRAGPPLTAPQFKCWAGHLSTVNLSRYPVRVSGAWERDTEHG